MRRTEKPLRKRELFEILRESEKDVKTAGVPIPSQLRSVKFRLRSLLKSCQYPLRRVDFLEERSSRGFFLGRGAYVRWVRFRMIL